jgi:hypothetical protein
MPPQQADALLDLVDKILGFRAHGRLPALPEWMGWMVNRGGPYFHGPPL